MPRSSRPITITLGELLDREEAALDNRFRKRVDHAFADPRPSRPAARFSNDSAIITPDGPRRSRMSRSSVGFAGGRRKHGLCLSPHGGEPGLLVARQAGRPVVVPQLDEAGGGHLAAPGVEIEEAAVATAAEAFLVVPPRIRAEQDALRPQGAGELA